MPRLVEGLLLLLFYLHHATGNITEHHKYCVVGAGASGLQLTAHLAHDKRDVVLIEKSPSVGSSWNRYPIDRKLRSIHHMQPPHRSDTTHHQRLLATIRSRVQPDGVHEDEHQRGQSQTNDPRGGRGV